MADDKFTAGGGYPCRPAGQTDLSEAEYEVRSYVSGSADVVLTRALTLLLAEYDRRGAIVEAATALVKAWQTPRSEFGGWRDLPEGMVEALDGLVEAVRGDG